MNKEQVDDDAALMDAQAIARDFYRCPTTGDTVYRWADDRHVLIPADELRSLRERATDLDWSRSDHDWLERQYSKEKQRREELRQVVRDVIERVFPTGRPSAMDDVWLRAYAEVES